MSKLNVRRPSRSGCFWVRKASGACGRHSHTESFPVIDLLVAVERLNVLRVSSEFSISENEPASVGRAIEKEKTCHHSATTCQCLNFYFFGPKYSRMNAKAEGTFAQFRSPMSEDSRNRLIKSFRSPMQPRWFRFV